MFTIGDFARLGRVSVRMLRHYDATGLLVPARVDPWSGYRYYEAVQLNRLNRLVALKDLGFTLDQVRSVLDDEVSAEELRGMLRLRRSELAEQIAADTGRLARVEARLRSIESEDTMSDHEFTVTAIPGHRLATLAEEVESIEGVGPVVGPLFGRLAGALAAAGTAPATGPTVATYDVSGDGVVVRVGFPYDGGPADGVDVVDLPDVEQAVRSVYHGPMSGIGDAWQQLMRRADAEGWTPAGPAREVYLEAPMNDPDGWVTELQQPVRKA